MTRVSPQLLILLPFFIAACSRADPLPPSAVAIPDSTEARQRLADDAAGGRPFVAHVVVALCDNLYQGIVPVKPSLGNGQRPRTNLYWGAAFGLKTYLTRSGWKLVGSHQPPRPEILERIVLSREASFVGRPVRLFVVADAWNGKEMRPAIDAFLAFSAGRDAEKVHLGDTEIDAGGAAHLIAFVGHNGLMDFSLERAPAAVATAPARTSVALACASQPYFVPHLASGGSFPLLFTTGLMAPEAYTLDAALMSWFGGQDVTAVHEAVAAAYHRYQKCGLDAARRLFWTPP